MEKIKVVWICNFSNEVVRSKLPLSNRKIINSVRALLGKEKLNYYNIDFAPWVTNQIIEFEKIPSVELHVISPHYGLIPFIKSFVFNGIYYHFFRPELPFQIDTLFRQIIRKKRSSFLLNRYLISSVIKRISPDIINLIGSENPYYSISVLDVRNRPVFVSCQTVYSNPMRKTHSGTVDNVRWNTELKIHEQIHYYGCAGRMHRDLVLNNNPKAFIFKYFFPVSVPKCSSSSLKIYEFVFFASGITKQKGIEDAIHALSIVKVRYPKVVLNVVGQCNPDYFNDLLVIINNLYLTNNVVFNSYFPLQSDMHNHIQSSRFALLPLKLDVISSSLIEAIYLDLPVVTYRTSGTPFLNRDGQAVLIADMNNITELAGHMIALLESPELADSLKTTARAFVEKEFNNSVSAQRLVKIYHAVINHYSHGKPIPDELLFNPDEFPIY